MLLVDDVHWADPPSHELLAYLLRRLRGNPVLVVSTWSPEETPAEHPARLILADAAREGLACTVSPSRLRPEDVGRLAADASDELVARLYAETQGIPFFVVEYLDARADEGADWPVPQGVRDVLEARIAASGELAAQVLAAGAVIGRSFTHETARDVSGRGDEETVSALDELTGRGILAETEGAYDFRHEQTRRVAYERTSGGRRRLLHRRAAETLAARLDAPALSATIAQHFRLAGRDAEASVWFVTAGERARDLYANSEALAHFRDALALGLPAPAAVNEQIGDLCTLAGDYAGALSSYEAAAALAGPERLGALEHRIGLVHHRRGEWQLAESSFDRALIALDGDAAPQRARLIADRSLNAHRLGRDGEAQDLAEEALGLAAAAGDRRALAQAHNILGIL